ncbi:hypothetical protein F5Y17DRAFT_332245 [Xylariaceae sp. FL0594]|nr:hypothetical protein F5Y17DRAFT_332245 [Xylariaceae sp. FL0594]
MAPAEGLSAPGSATYDSDTMTVGDGTWDFSKNTFLLPNLVGLNFETMQYNGMGNRFATVPQYHRLITGHGVLAAITFLFVVPLAIFLARFHRDHTRARRLHIYLQVVTVGLATVVFVLGFFAVGPSRRLTNPHHGIGVAIYVLVLVQALGGTIVRRITKKSFRLFIHRWLGSATALLGIVQIPLGLTLYGSPKFTFILYALWMGFLLLLFFFLSFRHEPNWDDNESMYGPRSAYEGRSTYGGRSVVGRSESGVGRSGRTSRRGSGWLPLAAGLGIGALLRGRKRAADQGKRRGGSPSQSGRTPEVLPSRRGSPSYFDEDEKSSGRTDRREGGFVNKLLGVGGVLGAGVLAKKLMNRKGGRRHDEEYSAVATETPSRYAHRQRGSKRPPDDYTESDFTEDRTELGPRPRTPLLPGPGNPAATAAALSGAEPRPSTPRASHGRPGQSTLLSNDVSDYTSYVSPSRRMPAEDPRNVAGKGLLGVLGLGWLAKRMRGRQGRRGEEERFRDEEDRRESFRESRYTGDPYTTPTRPTRQRPPRRTFAPTATTMSEDTESMVETVPRVTGHGGPPMPPLDTAHGAAGGIRTVGSRSRSGSRSRAEPEHVAMPPMPEDPRGLLHSLNPESGAESYASPSGQSNRRRSSRQRREGERAAAAAAAAGGSAQGSSHQRDRSQARSQSVSVKVKYHDDRNVTLRRLTDEEARREQRRGRSDSVSSLSESDTPGGRRYRRDESARRRAEPAAEPPASDALLSPPSPAFAGGRRAAKDSAYYSGQPDPAVAGPSNAPPLTAPTVSSIGSPASHGTWSALSPSPPGPSKNQGPGSISASAAERRRRRKLSRQPPGGTVEFN